MLPMEDQSVAHLIPNDASCLLAWLKALSIVTGIDLTNSDKAPFFNEKLQTFVEGKGPENENAPTNLPSKRGTGTI